MSSSRIIKIVSASVFAIGLAAVGIGWQAQEPPRPPAPQRAYCSIDQLLRYHPAWNQYVQLHGLPSDLRSTGDGLHVDSGDVNAPAVMTIGRPQASDRGALRSTLEERTGRELSAMGGKLESALNTRLKERRAELVATADALAADDRRDAEQALAADMRRLSESGHYDSLDSEIKLSALRAQVTAQGAAGERVKAAIAARERSVADAKTRLANDEDSLRRKALAKVAAARSERIAQIDAEIAKLRTSELARIDDRIVRSKDRLNGDLGNKLASGFGTSLEARTQTIGAGVGAGGRAGKVVKEARAEYSAAAKKAVGAASERDAMRRRMTEEIKAVVTRIAGQNGIQVVFSRDSGARDSTKWFRDRLPYATVRRVAG